MVSDNTKRIAEEIKNRISQEGINEQCLKDLLDVAVHAFEKEQDEKWGLKVTKYIKECCEYGIRNGIEILQLDALYWSTLKEEAPYWFESYLIYMERKRQPQKRFYEPRQETLKIVVKDLQDLEDGIIEFYGLSLPPRVGKSTVCIFFLSWAAGRHPDLHNAMGGHSGILAKGFYKEFLNLITSAEYCYSEIFPNVTLESKSADEFTINLNTPDRFATLTCRGIDGTWTGAVDISVGAYLYVDDLIRDRTESLSPIRLENRYQDYLNVMVDRKNDGAKELMVGTRWNIMDPLGRNEERLKNNPKARFRKIPALNEKDESNFNYKYGAGFSTQYYRDLRERLDKNEWMAKYQQRPFVREGLLFPEDELNFYNGVLPDGEYITVAACDPSFGGEDSLSMPIGKIRKDDFNSPIYITDWLFTHGNKDVTVPLIVSKAMQNEVTRLQIEANNGGRLFADFVDEKFKEREYRIAITTPLASNKMAKTEKILLYSADIKRKCYFLDAKYRGEDYKKAMDEMEMYTQTGKNPHDDSVDSLVQLIQLIEQSSAKVTIINSPI